MILLDAKQNSVKAGTDPDKVTMAALVSDNMGVYFVPSLLSLFYRAWDPTRGFG
jgi:hypothetical protein